jgi:Protein of unknown function (DUF2637)
MSQTAGNATYWTARVIVNGFALGAIALSFNHIVDFGGQLGMGWQSWLAPFFVDGLALLGRLGTSKKFAAKTRRAGHRLMLGAGTLSLAANIAAGHTLGTRVFGAMVVVGFVVAEWYAAQLAPVTPRGPRTRPTTPAVTPAPAAAPKTRRCSAGCACGKHNRRPTAKLETAAQIQARYEAASAPVSPAPAGAGNFGYL